MSLAIFFLEPSPASKVRMQQLSLFESSAKSTMDGKHKRNKTATSCPFSVKELVKSGLEKSELMRVQSQLNQLSKLVNSEVRRITDEEKKHGSQFKGKGQTSANAATRLIHLVITADHVIFVGLWSALNAWASVKTGAYLSARTATA